MQQNYIEEKQPLLLMECTQNLFHSVLSYWKPSEILASVLLLTSLNILQQNSPEFKKKKKKNGLTHAAVEASRALILCEHCIYLTVMQRGCW